MFMPPQPRFRFYGTPGNYVTVAKDMLLWRIDRGEDVDALEERVATMTGAPHALALPQARFGIYLALRELIEPGQKVILSPYTIYDVVNMVICAGGRPVFADIERQSCNIDPRQVEQLLDDETGAVLVTHLHGLACEVAEIAEMCRARGIPLIEDAAQAFGGRVGGKSLGTFGDVGIFSFGRAKNVNAFYGGVLVCHDQGLYDRLREALAGLPLEDKGRLLKRVAHCIAGDILTSPPAFSAATYWLFRHGCLHDVQAVNKLVQTEDTPVLRETLPEHYRRRMTPMQARVAARQLEEVEAATQARVDHARAYHAGLSHLQNVLLPPLREDGSHIYLSYPIQVEDRWGLVKHLMRHGRDVSVQHIANTADMPCFAAHARDCRNARLTSDQVVLLPTYPGYRRSEVEKTVAAVRSYLGTA